MRRSWISRQAPISVADARRTAEQRAQGLADVPEADDLGARHVADTGDVIALDGDPTADINAVLDVDFVMRDGIIFKRNGSEVKE